MKVLLHMCCAPCSIYPISLFKESNTQFEGLYFNPNIHPLDEFLRRKNALMQLSKIESFKLRIFDNCDQNFWHFYKNDIKTRCQMCYETRIEFTVKYAKENNFDAFTSTLFISPYQDHEYMLNACNFFSNKYNIDFMYKDFRVGFKIAKTKAKELDLYCQKYCGCITSLVENPIAMKYRKRILKTCGNIDNSSV